MEQQHNLTLIPEWEPQDLIILSWPHEGTDWVDMLDEVEACYIEIARTILRFEDLLVLSPKPDRVRKLVGEGHTHNLFLLEMESNDTWCRDYAPLSFRVNTPEGNINAIADFTFNGWGMKFASCIDNLMTRSLYLSRVFRSDVQLLNRLMLILEGGGIESDGRGTILSTYSCIFEPNRNPGFEEEELQKILFQVLGASRLILLRNGELEGDDTDGHIDTLVRFVSEDTIAYVQCEDARDEHYYSLKRMEAELMQLRTLEGEPYTLVPLPLPRAIYEKKDGHRLPATYANFLFVNGAVLVPIYNQECDIIALGRLQEALPELKVIGIDCRALIRQHGSLHCATMQIPQGFINKNKWRL